MPHPCKKKMYRCKSFHFTSGQLCVTGRGFNNLSQVRMGRHITTGQLVAIKQTNLDDCTEEELLQLLVGCCIRRMVVLTCFCFTSVTSDLCLKTQSEVLLSRLFRHPNLLSARLVFSSCCQLWVLTPLMAYGQPFLYLHVSVGTQRCATHCAISSLAFSDRLCRQLTENLFPRWNERIPGSVPPAWRFESIGIPSSNGLRAPVCEKDKGCKSDHLFWRCT